MKVYVYHAFCHSSYHWITRWCRKFQNLQLRSLHWPSACILLCKTHMPFSFCTNPLYLFVHPFLWKYLCVLLICTAKNEILYELYSSAISIQSHKAALTVKNMRGLVSWAFRMQLVWDNVNNITLQSLLQSVHALWEDELKHFIALAVAAKKFDIPHKTVQYTTPIVTYCIVGCLTANNYQLKS